MTAAMTTIITSVTPVCVIPPDHLLLLLMLLLLVTAPPHPVMSGMRVLPTAAYESFPDCMHPQDAFPRYVMPDVEPEQVGLSKM